MAGLQPLAGASVQLYAAGATGNGSAASGLLGSTVSTDAKGGFAIASGYGCPASSSQLYLVARGGQVGSGSANPAIAFVAPVGRCDQVNGSANVVVNEVTTAATAWGLAQFLSVGGNVGASTTNASGLMNAFATVSSLVNTATGSSPGAKFPSTGSSPAPKINSVANLLNGCAAAASASACSSLFAATTVSGSAAPDNTLDAVLNLVRNPGSNIAQLYAQSAANMVFQPALAAAPSDWTLFVNFTGGGMMSPSGVGVDGVGNVWVASYEGVASEFSPTGASLFASALGLGGLYDSKGLAIDGQNNIWIPDQDGTDGVNGNLGSVTVLSSTGQLISGATGFSSGGMEYPVAVAIDPSDGNAWIANYGNASLTLLSSTGQPLSGAKGYNSNPPGQVLFPVAVAVDANHNAWVANYSGTTIAKVSGDGRTFTSFACCNNAAGIAIDQRGDVWVSNYFGDSISQLSSDGTVISTGYSDNQASIYRPQGIAVDGSGNIWVANLLGNSITELSGSASNFAGKILSPVTGYGRDAAFLQAYAIAVDASGNLWVTNFGKGTLTEVIGLAVPVKTPLLGPARTP